MHSGFVVAHAVGHSPCHDADTTNREAPSTDEGDEADLHFLDWVRGPRTRGASPR